MGCLMCQGREAFLERLRSGQITFGGLATLCEKHQVAMEKLLELIFMSDEEFEAWMEDNNGVARPLPETEVPHLQDAM